jgi:hypothetical protein
MTNFGKVSLRSTMLLSSYSQSVYDQFHKSRTHRLYASHNLLASTCNNDDGDLVFSF